MDSEQAESLRAFLAIPLAPYFGESVAPLIKKCRETWPEIRWVQPFQIHITLHFFGSLNSNEITLVSQCASPIANRTTPFAVFLQDIGGFPDLRHPKVIWMDVRGEVKTLCDLQEGLEERLRKTGFECERRPFRPHLTLGRIKQKKAIFGLDSISFDPTATKQIREMVLFKSTLSTQGPSYEAIKTYPFSAA